MLKIISGKYKGRIIPTVRSGNYRPTTTKLKEAIFSIIASGNISQFFDIERANVLDVFSGTGSLAFEALSRGARQITMIDSQHDYLKTAQLFAKTIEVTKYCNFLKLDASNLPFANQTFDLIFIDPPYSKDLATKAIEQLMSKNWLSQNSIIVVELAKKEDIFINLDQTQDNFIVLKQSIYGNSKLLILKFARTSF